MVQVTLIGEICEDLFIYGKVERICPEAPVPIFKPQSEQTNLGMVGNVLNNVNFFLPNASVSLYTQAKLIRKTRIVDIKSNQMIVRIDYGENEPCDSIKIDDNFIQRLRMSDIVIVSDYNKGFLSSEDLIKIANESKLSILDSKRKLSDEITKKFTFVKLNELEFKNNENLSNFDNIIITLGPNGAMFRKKNYPTSVVKETIDVCGAGDTFVSGFITKYYSTNNIDESINFANLNCVKVVSKKGVNIPD